MRLRSLFLITVLALLPACSMSQESRQLADEAAVTFVGSTTGVDFQVDDSKLMPLGQSNARYVIEAGTHVIRVFRKGELVVQQKIYASPGQTVELRIP